MENISVNTFMNEAHILQIIAIDNVWLLVTISSFTSYRKTKGISGCSRFLELLFQKKPNLSECT